MASAPPYTPTTSFASNESTQAAGRSTVRTASVDTEFANISSSINALKANAEIIQRDDGKVRDFAIEPYALSEQTRALMAVGGTPRGIWAATTLYAVKDVVQYGTIAYICYVQHTSTGVFDQSKFISISGDGSAAFSASQAATSADNAAASATLSSGHAGTSATSATNAAASATNAATQAGNASTNAGIALGHANNASTYATNAALSYDSFDDRYLGAKASDPTTDNDGNVLLTGAIYWNSTSSKFRGWTGSAWGDGVGILDATLTAIAALDATAGLVEQTGPDAFTKTPVTAFARTLLDDADAATARATLAITNQTIASTAEAQSGTVNTNMLTPLRMREGFNATGTAPIYACRAWVNFNGTGTVAIRASGNLSSITDNGVGDYTVNFTTAMPDANYSTIAATAANAGTNRTATFVINSDGSSNAVAPTTTAMRGSSSAGNAAFDSADIHIAFFR